MQLTIFTPPVIDPILEIPFLEDGVEDNSAHCRSFADELYPPNREVIDTMLNPYAHKHGDRPREYLRKHRILDPSAGKGDILDRIRERFNLQYDRSHKLFAIEISQDLRHILNDKDFGILDADFLQFNDPVKFDLIVMNPPFSAGAKHLLHAWELLDHGGDLVCLLNKETLANPYTQDRKYLNALIEQHGSTEDLGQCFQNSERPTNVEVVLVRLARPKLETGYSFDGVKFQVDGTLGDFTDFGQSPLADRNIIKTLVKHYEIASNLVIERYRSQELLGYHLKNVTSEYVSSDCFKLPSSLDEQLCSLKVMFWETLFRETKLSEKMTSTFQRNFNEFCTKQKRMSFSIANIYEVIEEFFLNREEIMIQGVVEIFDATIALSEENRIGEGWKTNSSYRVNQKIIHPWGITYEKQWGFGWRCRNIDYTLDLDKSMAYLSGVIDYVSIPAAIKKHVDSLSKAGCVGNDYAQPFQSTFFEIKIFKKGTVHLKFRDKSLWEKFNTTAARGKKWLGKEESDFTKRQ